MLGLSEISHQAAPVSTDIITRTRPVVAPVERCIPQPARSLGRSVASVTSAPPLRSTVRLQMAALSSPSTPNAAVSQGDIIEVVSLATEDALQPGAPTEADAKSQVQHEPQALSPSPLTRVPHC